MGPKGAIMEPKIQRTFSGHSVTTPIGKYRDYVFHLNKTLQELQKTDILQIPIDIFLKKSEDLFKIFCHNAISFGTNKTLYRASKLEDNEPLPLTKKRLTYNLAR